MRPPFFIIIGKTIGRHGIDDRQIDDHGMLRLEAIDARQGVRGKDGLPLLRVQITKGEYMHIHQLFLR